MSKTTMYVVGGAGALGIAGLIYYFATKKPALPPGGGGTQPVIGSTSPAVTGGKPVATSNSSAGLPAPTGSTTTNPLATANGVNAALQNPQQFLQDVSNFLNGAAAFKQGFQIVNTVYSAIQSFAAANLNYYLPALDPASFGFVF
jgi:hypothetical protein